MENYWWNYGKIDSVGYFQCGISLNHTLVQSVAWAGGSFPLETLDDRVA